MKEEIEKIVNKVNYEMQKHINNGYAVDMLIPLEFDVSQWNLLLDYIVQLETNWNKLKKWLEETLNELKENDIYDRTSYEAGQIISIECMIAKIEELEKQNVNNK